MSLFGHPDGQRFPRKKTSDALRQQEDALLPLLLDANADTEESSHTKFRSHFC